MSSRGGSQRSELTPRIRAKLDEFYSRQKVTNEIHAKIMSDLRNNRCVVERKAAEGSFELWPRCVTKNIV